ncbi:MAG: helicase-related protein [Bacteroidota bacterium]|nr:helicase-related protein [Bacteroidota bacterium]
MAKNFITNNSGEQTLRKRLNTLISISDELKFLVGFFYFSGWQELFQSLKSNDSIKLKLLVGLQVDKLLSSMAIFEYGVQEDGLSQEDHFNQFMSSLGFALNNDAMDTEAFYNQVSYFLHMIQEGRLQIRKTENPNHAKLYLFHLNENQSQIQNMTGQFVTGSSNLTKAGLGGQEEFNVEIKDYGFEDAEQYFDELWERAIPITEDDGRRKFLTQFIEHKSLAATVTPFEAYALILKTYLDLQQQKVVRPEVENILEEIGFKKFSYQLDAVNQALSIINEYNGVIIADVVGLGKSVIASLIAKNLGQRGMVICPPGLIGDKTLSTGWWGYINDFKLYDWEVESRGKLEELAENIHNKDIDVVIIDEAHYFRNQDTADYEALQMICRDRKVILLTATPFNNSPADIFSLLKLFIVPGKSGITIEDNLESLFQAHNYRFKKLSDISKYHNSSNPEKVKKAEKLYVSILGEQLPIDIKKVRVATSVLANQIKNTISSVVIRRNRLDLKSDFEYASEVGEMSEIKDPFELFYELSPQQSDFYDRIISQYFIEDGRFKGAIYQPFSYEFEVIDEDELDEAGNRAFQQQRNLFDFMRRLLVKRFESSFGAFASSIDRFLKVHELVREFIDNSGGKYILDRQLIEKIKNYDEEEIIDVLEKFENDLLDKKIPKNNTVYIVDKFQRGDEFIADIENDIQLFKDIKQELEELDLVNNDPKRESVYGEIEGLIKEGPEKRKVIIFSEYVDTIKHLEGFFRDKIGNRVLVCDGKVSKELAKHLNSDFNAQIKGAQTDFFDVLLTSDKLSEGFNLNRAGVIVNYDIPWNPTRVIQRVGRINRIGAKVYDELFIYNFFPSEAGADIVKSKEIAAQKMFLIHSSLGEDSKIFDPDEEPTAAGLFNKINESPDSDEELNLSTLIRNRFKEINDKYPEVIERISSLPNRVKSAKKYEVAEVNVLRKKGLSLFAQTVLEPKAEENKVKEITIEELLPRVECEFDEKHLKLSNAFWPAYETIKNHKPKHKTRKSEASIETKAFKNLKLSLKIIDPKEESLASFIKILIKDIREFRTLSQRTLGRLGRKELSPSSSSKAKKAFFDEVIWIRNNLGDDYLTRILKRVEHQKNEVIIAVENIEDQ